MVSVTLVILLAAIVVFFAGEFAGLIGKVMAIRSVKLFLPLTLATLSIVLYEAWVYWGLFYFKKGVHLLIDGLASLLPTHNQALSSLVLIYLMTLIPLALLFYRKKKYPFYYQTSQLMIAAVLWLLLSITLTVEFY